VTKFTAMIVVNLATPKAVAGAFVQQTGLKVVLRTHLIYRFIGWVNNGASYAINISLLPSMLGRSGLSIYGYVCCWIWFEIEISNDQEHFKDRLRNFDREGREWESGWVIVCACVCVCERERERERERPKIKKNIIWMWDTEYGKKERGRVPNKKMKKRK